MLKVTDPNDNEVKNVTGLVHTENGFDITARTGGFLLISDYDIEVERGKTTTQEWNIEVTFVNLDTNQSANAGKALSGKLYLTKEKMSSYKLSEITNVSAETTFDSTTTLDISEGSAKIDKYYYTVQEDQSLSSESGSSDFVISGLMHSSTYTICVVAEDYNGRKSEEYCKSSETDTFEVRPEDFMFNLDNVGLHITFMNVDERYSIQKYYYSLDGSTYYESDMNTYTFEEYFEEGLTYQFCVKIEDHNGWMTDSVCESFTT